MEEWSGHSRGCKALYGLRTPTESEAMWKLASGDLGYARFKVIQTEFRNPSAYE